MSRRSDSWAIHHGGTEGTEVRQKAWLVRAAVGGALASPAAAFALEAEKCRIVLRGVGVAGSEGNSNALGGMGWGGDVGFWDLRHWDATLGEGHAARS